MRLIDADALIAEYDRVHVGEPGGARKLMCDAPTVEERKTGKWIDGKRIKFDGTFYWFRQCDQCGYERNDCDTEKDSNFCPDCGAKMEGEADD